MSNLEELYRARFSAREERRKNRLWGEICRYLKKYLNADYKTVVDVAAGYGDFINNFETGARKYALDANPALKDRAAKDVTPYIDGVENLKKYFAADSVSLFFVSNFLEHITRSQISTLFRDIYTLLERGGTVYPYPQHPICRRKILGFL